MFTFTAIGVAAFLMISNIYVIFFEDYRDVEEMFNQRNLIGKIGVRIVYPIPAVYYDFFR